MNRFFHTTTFPSGPFRYNFDASDAYVGTLWRNLYTGIERANTLLFYLDDADMDKNKTIAKGEALFLRAFYYFTLVQYYGDVPLKLIPSVSVNDVDIARTPSKEVYAKIITDMKEAETTSENGYGYQWFRTNFQIDRTGILARVYLTMAGAPLHDAEKFKDAREWALKVKRVGRACAEPRFHKDLH